jgi:membrane-bound metal-dependent hydrolase YbcI (DUF457 family)
MLPDLDAAVGIAFGNLGRYHNNFAGAPAFGVLVAAALGGVTWLVRPAAAKGVLLLALVCYQIHVLMDFLTIGRGVMLLWPLSSERFAPPFYLFYGLRWSDGVFSSRHFITVFSELGSAAVLFVALWLHSRRRYQRSG